MNEYTYPNTALRLRNIASIFAIVFGFIIVSGLTLTQQTQAGFDCSGNSWNVSNEEDLNNSIACYNAKTTTGDYNVKFTNNISLTTSVITISNRLNSIALTIDGADFTINGQDIKNVRPFTIDVTTTVTINNITITGGSIIPDPHYFGYGGGILNSGILTLNNSTVTHNYSSNYGAGISNRGGGKLTINNSTFSNNLAEDGGAAIHNNNSSLVIDHSTFANNRGFNGGAINNNRNGTFTVTHSTFVENVSHLGGAIINSSDGNVSNSTFSRNSSKYPWQSTSLGGAIFNDGTIIINDTTFSENIGIGAIYNRENMTIRNTVLYRGAGGQNCFLNLQEPITSGGHNISSDTSCNFGGTEDLNGIDPLLEQLQDNGGATFTHTLLPDSPAIDSGSSSLATDQRGIPRPQGSTDDRGAFEVAHYHTLTTHKIGTGLGTITTIPTNINCGITCTDTIVSKTVLTLTAIADPGSIFTGWSGLDCTGTDDCILTMDAAKTVSATFTLNQYNLITNTIGNGTIYLDPPGGVYDYGTVVTVTQSADANSNFVEWSGDCTGSKVCTLVMDANKSVTAQFKASYWLYLPILINNKSN